MTKPDFSQLPAEMLEFFRRTGAKGGKKSSRNMTKAERSARARRANDVRWAEQRRKKGQVAE